MVLASIFWWPVIAGFGALAILVALVFFVFWLWMLIDCITRNFKNTTEKVIWVIVVVLLGWLGALLYLILVKYMNPTGLSKK